MGKLQSKHGKRLRTNTWHITDGYFLLNIYFLLACTRRENPEGKVMHRQVYLTFEVDYIFVQVL